MINMPYSHPNIAILLGILVNKTTDIYKIAQTCMQKLLVCKCVTESSIFDGVKLARIIKGATTISKTTLSITTYSTMTTAIKMRHSL